MFKLTQTRHFERSEAIKENMDALRPLDCFVAVARRKKGVPINALWHLAVTMTVRPDVVVLRVRTDP
jgi:hypothetical protein